MLTIFLAGARHAKPKEARTHGVYYTEEQSNCTTKRNSMQMEIGAFFNMLAQLNSLCAMPMILLLHQLLTGKLAFSAAAAGPAGCPPPALHHPHLPPHGALRQKFIVVGMCLGWRNNFCFDISRRRELLDTCSDILCCWGKKC